MKRFVPFLACAAGLVLLWLLLPQFNSSQPQGIRLTRAEAKAAADREARRAGIPVDQSWSILSWGDRRSSTRSWTRIPPAGARACRRIRPLPTVRRSSESAV